MVYRELVGNESLQQLLTYPLTGNYYFYVEILLLPLFVIFTLILFFEEYLRTNRANFISCMALSSIGTSIVAYGGSLTGMITNDILIITIVLTIILNIIWLLTSDN